MLYAFTETTEEKHLLIRLFIYLYNQAISEKQCIIMNITVNMPESKDQKTSFHSAAPGHVQSCQDEDMGGNKGRVDYAARQRQRHGHDMSI